MMVLKNDRLHKMETGWNNRVTEEPQGKFVRPRDKEEIMDLFLQQQGKIPIPELIPVVSAHPRARTSSKRGDASRGGKKQPNNRGDGGNNNNHGPNRTGDDDCEPSSVYASITRAFDFEHHKGTDRNLELRVLKLILKRENALLEIQAECQSIRAVPPVLRNSKKTGILDLMCGIRDLTIEITEAITTWRKSMVSYDPALPRPFKWQQQNYLLKMVDDLNFLSIVDPLVEVLNLPQQKLMRNPLMLPETLDESAEHSHLTPEARSEADLDGEKSGPHFAERLRIRMAEDAILKEIEFNKLGDPSIAWSDYNPSLVQGEGSIAESETFGGTSLTEEPNNRRRSFITGKGSPITMEASDVKKLEALVDWHQNAGSQLGRISSSVGEHLHSASTERLKIPSPGAEQSAAKFSFKPVELVEPSLLTNLRLSSSEGRRTASGGNGRSSSPYLRPLDENNNSPSSNEKVKSAGKGSEQMLSSLDAWPSMFDNANSQKSKKEPNAGGSRGVREIKRLPGSQTDDNVFGFEYSTDIESGVINSLLGIVDAPKVARLVAASILILLSSSDDIPEDLSWESFVVFAKAQDIPRLMKALVPRDIPKFKIRSVLPFLSQMDVSSLSTDNSVSSEVVESLSQIVSWLKEVIYYDEAANAQNMKKRNEMYNFAAEDQERHAKRREPPLVAPPSRKAKGIKSKRFNPYIKLSTDTSAGGSTEAFALQKKNPSPVPTNLKVVYSELVADIYVRPLVLSLLVKNTDFSEPSPLSPAVKVNFQEKQTPVNFTIKLYDPSAEQSAETVINVKEYMNHQQDLRVKFNNNSEVNQLYQPHKVGWWIENLKSLVVVSLKPQGDLVIRISKSKIARMIARHIGVYYQLDADSLDATTAESPDVRKSNESFAKQPQSAPSASKKEHTKSAPALASLYQRPAAKHADPVASNPPSAQGNARANLQSMSASKKGKDTVHSKPDSVVKENKPSASSSKPLHQSHASDNKLSKSASKPKLSEEKSSAPAPIASRSPSIEAEGKNSDKAPSKLSSKDSFESAKPNLTKSDSKAVVAPSVNDNSESVTSDAKPIARAQSKAAVVEESNGSKDVAPVAPVVSRSESKSAVLSSTAKSEDYGNEYEEDEFEAVSPMKQSQPVASDAKAEQTVDQPESKIESEKSSDYLLNLALLDDEPKQNHAADGVIETAAKADTKDDEENEYGDEEFDF